MASDARSRRPVRPPLFCTLLLWKLLCAFNLNDAVLIGHIFYEDRPPPQSLVCLCLSTRTIVAFARLLLVSICALRDPCQRITKILISQSG